MPKLPSFTDVKTVSPRVASDPGLQVPAGAFQGEPQSALGVAAEEFAPALGQLSEAQRIREAKLEEARTKQNNRKDTVNRADIINRFTEESDNEKRRLNTEADFSSEDTLVGYGGFLTERKKALIEEHRAAGASEDSIAKLTVRLGGIESVATGDAAGISVKLGREKVEKVYDNRLVPLGESAARDPSINNLNMLLAIDAPGVIEDLSDAFDPTEEQARLDTAREHVVLSATDRLIKQGRVEEAESLLTDGRMNRFLTPEKQREVRNTVETVRIARDEKLGKLTEREKRRNRLRARGFSDAFSDDVSSGDVRVVGPDKFGNYSLVNIVEKTQEPVQVSEEDKVNLDAIVAEETPQPTQQQSSLEQAVEQGTGPFAKIQAGISNLFGPFIEGSVFEDTTDSRQQIRIFSQVAKTAVVNNDKFPVKEQEIVAKFLPDVDAFFQDPDKARSDLQELEKSLNGFKDAKTKELDKKISSQRKADLADQISRIDEILTLMNEEGEGSPTISAQEEIDKLPKGTRFIWGPTGEEYEKE